MTKHGKSEALPAGLINLRRRLTVWRRSHRRGARLPESLWSEAASLAWKHGHNRTARALGLDYNSLKKHMGAVSGRKEKLSPAAPSFVEFLSPCPVECSIEVEKPDGTKFRLSAKGVTAGDMVCLCRSAWLGES